MLKALAVKNDSSRELFTENVCGNMQEQWTSDTVSLKTNHPQGMKAPLVVIGLQRNELP